MNPSPEPEPPLEPEPPEEEDMVIVIIRSESDATQYILNTDGRKYRLGSADHARALNKLESKGVLRIEGARISDAEMAAIPDEHV